jgi:hypothetical protein
MFQKEKVGLEEKNASSFVWTTLMELEPC